MRGVCMRHRNMQIYYERHDNLNEAWLVRNGKLLPSQRGIPHAAEAREPVLPRARLVGNDKLWLFGMLPPLDAKLPAGDATSTGA